MTPNYASRGDYWAKVSEYEEKRRKNAEALRTQPSVWFHIYGFDYACWASHPEGINGPQLPAPWIWDGEVWYCRIPFRSQAEQAMAAALKIFEIQLGD